MVFSAKDTNRGGSGGGAAKNRDLAHFRSVVKNLDLPRRDREPPRTEFSVCDSRRGQKQQESDGTNKHRDFLLFSVVYVQPIFVANNYRPYSSGVFWYSTVSGLA